MKKDKFNSAKIMIAISLFGVGASCAVAQSETSEKQPQKSGDGLDVNEVVDVQLPIIDVVGSRSGLAKVAGTVEVIRQKELSNSRVLTTSEVLRKVSGLNVRDEEGLSLRPNIGFRGLNPTRSTKVTLLEDGMPLAYAPYGDNASYYHPQIDRFDRVEVMKGARSLQFGPQTISGIVNYVTADPTEELSGLFELAGGSRNYRKGRLKVSAMGGLIDYIRKEAKGARDNMNHVIDDLLLKADFRLTDQNRLTAKVNYFNENSQITYSGLTEKEYALRGYHYNPFKNDRFNTDRFGLSLIHTLELTPQWQINTAAYYSQFNRNWWRQSSTTTDSQCGSNFTSRRLAGDLVNPDECASRQGRLRNYDTYGLEPRVTWQNGLGELEAGVKLHYEKQNRKQINASQPTGQSGTLAEHNERQSVAYSAYLSQRMDVDDWSFTPVLRFEHIRAKRFDHLTNKSAKTSLNAWSPGFGAVYRLNDRWNVFSSIHRGFSPPRVEDLINGQATVTDVDAERSVNMELGVRGEIVDGLRLSATAFRNRFSNLIAVGAIAGGNTPLSQGRALFQGIEFEGKYRGHHGLFGRVAATWLPTAKQQSEFISVANKSTIGVKGNRQPYAPKITLSASAGVEKSGFRGELEAQYVGSQFSDFANTVNASADGQRGIIPSYTIWNAALSYAIDKKSEIYVSGKNILNKKYITDRTRGIQVGMPRTVQAGFTLKY